MNRSILVVFIAHFLNTGALSAKPLLRDERPSRQTEVLGSRLVVPHVGHGVALLPSGHLLIAGGAYTELGTVPEIEIYQTEKQRFRKFKGTMSEARSNATLTLLRNGDALIAGGASDFATALSIAELIREKDESVHSTGELTVARSGHTATLLPNGKVLIIGGTDGDLVLDTAEIYDPDSGKFQLIEARLMTPRANHTANLIDDRYILVTGGETGSTADSPSAPWMPLDSAELYDIQCGQFFSVSNQMTTAREYHQATTLTDGRILVTGGIWDVARQTASADIFDPAKLQFDIPLKMIHPRALHTATALKNGDALVCGGTANHEAVVECEIYSRSTDNFKFAFPLKVPRWQHQAITTSNGDVLILGGIAPHHGPMNSAGGPTDIVEILRSH